MKRMVNSVNIWSVDLVHVEDDAPGRSLFKSQYKRMLCLSANHATSLEVFFRFMQPEHTLSARVTCDHGVNTRRGGSGIGVRASGEEGSGTKHRGSILLFR